MQLSNAQVPATISCYLDTVPVHGLVDQNSSCIPTEDEEGVQEATYEGV